MIRTLVVYGSILPLAVIVGWMLSTPDSMSSLTVITGVLFVLLLPLILKFHFAFLVFSWNAAITLAFLPGQLAFWTMMVALNLGMAVLYRILQRRPLFISVPSITLSLLALAAIVVITAELRGGFGVRALGSSTYGAKGYFYLLAAIAGYFAFAGNVVPLDRIRRYVDMYLLSGTTAIVSNLIFFVPALWSLYLIFPVGLAVPQAQAEYFGTVNRLGGFAAAGSAVMMFMLARYGTRGLLTVRHWWRLPVFIALLFLTAMGGFRSSFVFIGLVVVILFVLEGLLRSPIFPAVIVACGLAFAVLLPSANKLPMAVQRTLSFLPVNVSPIARMDARASLDWRVRMWKGLAPDLPKYVWLGKGYALNPTDMYLTIEAIKRGFAPDYAGSLLVGDYHNGPLSVYVPFGMPGVLAFLVFLGASFRLLHHNYKYGDESLRGINRFFYAYFAAKVVFYVLAFGSLHSDMFFFTGIVGFSVALNRGMRKPQLTPAAAKATQQGGYGLPAPLGA